MWFRKKKQEPEQTKNEVSVFSTDLGPIVKSATPVSRQTVIDQRVPMVEGTMDSSLKLSDAGFSAGIPDAQFFWYATQSFIGYQACAILAQHWLIDKACLMPARDAIRQGYEIEGPDEDTITKLQKLNKKFGINKEMREFIHMGRIFGVRVAIFRVDSSDPAYYEKPFNIDGVEQGSYRGISQVDPIWCAPVLTDTSLTDPANKRFYDPEFWMINGKKYHRSHLCVYIPHPVPDTLKPNYMYGGVSVPQLIYERVYAAERTANEAPQLAMTKRLTVLKVNSEAFFSNLDQAKQNLLEWVGLRDNYGVKIVDKESEDLSQFDATLNDLDATIMTQYQLCAAIAEVPATKLLGTQPKGFNATGEHEAENYRQALESIQEHDLTPLLEKHMRLVMKSALGSTDEITISWMPLDSPTAEQWAAINLQKAQAAQIYASIGAIDGTDVREQLKIDRNSDFFGLAEIDETLTDYGEPESTGLDAALFDRDTGMFDGAKLITNQTFVNSKKVAEKQKAKDYTVQVSPVFQDEKGQKCRIIIDGHHSLTAAIADGVTPEFEETGYSGSDYFNAITKVPAFDGKTKKTTVKP